MLSASLWLPQSLKFAVESLHLAPLSCFVSIALKVSFGGLVCLFLFAKLPFGEKKDAFLKS